MERDGIVLNITGDTVALVPPRRDLVETYSRWRNDFGIMYRLEDVSPKTLDAEIERVETLGTNPATVRFTIYDRATLTPIGTTALNDIDLANGSAEYSILIGEADYRGRGYGTETTRLVLDYAFTALGLHTLLLRVFSYNPAAQRAYEKAGFRAFGRQREARMMGGRWWDVVYMEALASEFASPVLGRIFSPDVPR